MKCLLKELIIILCLVNIAYASDRIVVLSPAASDILEKLDLSDYVVGKTKYIVEFKDAKNVGTHLMPNLEIIMKLKPTHIISMRSNYSLDVLKNNLNSHIIIYDPISLLDVMKQIKTIGSIFNKKEKSHQLVEDLNAHLHSVKPIIKKPTVLYEVSSKPLILAGKNSIVYDIITRAGGFYPIDSKRKFFKTSIENIYKYSPDIYIYQVGPMNKNPIPPKKRKSFALLKNTKFIQVSQENFLRADTNVIKNIQFLNDFFIKEGYR